MGADIFSETEKTYDVSVAFPVHTKPACKVAIEDPGSVVPKLVMNDILASAAVLERGTYPIFLANETTF